MLRSIPNDLISIFYPRSCFACRAGDVLRDDGICSDCWANTRLFLGSEAICNKCGMLLGSTAPPVEVYCHQCDDHHYEVARAAGVYEHGLAATVVRLKTVPRISRTAADLLFEAFERMRLDISVIVPVPLARRRRHERSFNQADVIAEALAKRTGISVDALSLARKTHSAIHRVGMDRKARDLSVRNAFEVRRPKIIAGERILIVDDVFTTGATVSYCAKALKKARAESVAVLTLARAMRMPFGPE